MHPLNAQGHPQDPQRRPSLYRWISSSSPPEPSQQSRGQDEVCVGRSDLSEAPMRSLPLQGALQGAARAAVPLRSVPRACSHHPCCAISRAPVPAARAAGELLHTDAQGTTACAALEVSLSLAGSGATLATCLPVAAKRSRRSLAADVCAESPTGGWLYFLLSLLLQGLWPLSLTHLCLPDKRKPNLDFWGASTSPCCGPQSHLQELKAPRTAPNKLQRQSSGVAKSPLACFPAIQNAKERPNPEQKISLRCLVSPGRVKPRQHP